jgi:hypothetical protein
MVRVPCYRIPETVNVEMSVDIHAASSDTFTDVL